MLMRKIFPSFRPEWQAMQSHSTNLAREWASHLQARCISFIFIADICHVQVVVKSQILAGGRGLGKFKSGLQGGVHICSVDEAPKLAEQMLGQVSICTQASSSGTRAASSAMSHLAG